MKNYSIFERSMHWIVLIAIALKFISQILNAYFNMAFFPLEEEMNILFIAFKNSISSPLLLILFIYLGVSFQKYATNKRASLLLTIVLILYVLHDFLNLLGIYFSEGEGILFLLVIILFFPSVFNGEHMVIEKRLDEKILDDI